jgi:hypothetical protein
VSDNSELSDTPQLGFMVRYPSTTGAGRNIPMRLAAVQLFQEGVHVFASAREKDPADLRSQTRQRRA